MPSVDRDQAYQRIYALVDSIPAGCVASYGQIARESGLPRHARLVGRALRILPSGSQLPWYRVVNAAGRISERPGGSMARQRKLLMKEGVEVRPGGCVDLRRFGWTPGFAAKARDGDSTKSGGRKRRK